MCLNPCCVPVLPPMAEIERHNRTSCSCSFPRSWIVKFGFDILTMILPMYPPPEDHWYLRPQTQHNLEPSTQSSLFMTLSSKVHQSSSSSLFITDSSIFLLFSGSSIFLLFSSSLEDPFSITSSSFKLYLLQAVHSAQSAVSPAVLFGLLSLQ